MASNAHISATKVNERLVLFTLAAVQFTHVMDFMILMPLGSHLMRVFDITPGQFSWLVAAYSAAAAITGFIGGFLLDRFDRKHALIFLYAGFGLATLGCALANTYEVLLVARLAAGAFGGLAGSVVTAAVGDVIPAERRGTAMGVVMTAFPIASVLGVPVGLLLADAFEWHAPFYFLAGSSLIIGVLAHRFLPLLPPQAVMTPPVQQMKEIMLHPVHQRGFILSGVLVFGGGLIIPFMAPSMVANVGLSESQLPLIYLAGGAFTFFTMPWVGRLSDRYDKLHVFAAMSIPACISVVVLTNLPHVHVSVALIVTTAFMIFMSGRYPPAMTMVTNSVDARYRGGFMSVNSAMQQAAGAIANVVGGLFITREASGYLRGYTTNGIVTVLAFMMAIFLAARLRAIAPRASASATLVPAVGAK